MHTHTWVDIICGWQADNGGDDTDEKKKSGKQPKQQQRTKITNKQEWKKIGRRRSHYNIVILSPACGHCIDSLRIARTLARTHTRNYTFTDSAMLRHLRYFLTFGLAAAGWLAHFSFNFLFIPKPPVQTEFIRTQTVVLKFVCLFELIFPNMFSISLRSSLPFQLIVHNLCYAFVVSISDFLWKI